MMVITQAEALYLDRRRRHQTPKEYGSRYGVKSKEYSTWENGTCPIPPDAKVPTINNIMLTEYLILRRVRAKLSQRELARILKCCPWQICRMELGYTKPAELVLYWESRSDG